MKNKKEKTFICAVCKKEFKGYNNRKTCNQKCKSEYYKQQFKGENNPNFKNGQHYYSKYCPKCNAKIDYRAEKCKKCAGLLLIITEEAAKEAAKEAISYLSMGEYLNVSRQTAKSLIEKFNIDISHFKPGRGRKYKPKDILINGTQARNATVYSCVLEYDLLLNKCDKCGIENEWNEKPIRLNLHHINGNNKDNRIENLQILCPNCHSQTSNFTGKNRKRE